MIISNTIINVPALYLKMRNISPEKCLLFDIETTGLSWQRSHLYLLGAVFWENEQWTLRQWFCQRPGEEKEILLQFSQLLKTRQWLIHFNGNTFDIPYLMHKYTFYRMEQSWEGITHLDFYQELLPYKKILKQPHMRQKDLEIFCGIHRKDTFTGGELISCYQEYLKSGDEELYEILTLHNREDVEGMIQLLPLLLIPELFQGRLTKAVNVVHSDAETVLFKIPFSKAFPVCIQAENPWFTLAVSPSECLLTVRIKNSTLRYFFPNYKDYYYLPLEDEAIHKSVGAYVDKDHREKAKASNCYKKVTGQFLPEFEPVYTPMFHMEYKDNVGWFSADSILHAERENPRDSELLKTYVNHLLKHVRLMKNVAEQDSFDR